MTGSVEAPDAARRWQAPALIRGSLAWHALLAAGVVARPEWWPWALGGAAANHALLTAVGLWPRSTWLGPNWVRLPEAAARRGEIALTIDDGPDPEVTPTVLDLLDHHHARATFFCVGERAARHAELAREIVAHGHAVENHSQHHRHNFPLLGPQGFAREIGAAQATLAAITGQTPRFFRAPAGLRNPLLEPQLARLGLTLASWTRRGFDTVNHDPARVVRRLTRGLAPGDILLLHDGHAARDAWGTPVILAALPAVLDAVARAGLRPVTLREALR